MERVSMAAIWLRKMCDVVVVILFFRLRQKDHKGDARRERYAPTTLAL